MWQAITRVSSRRLPTYSYPNQTRHHQHRLTKQIWNRRAHVDPLVPSRNASRLGHQAPYMHTYACMHAQSTYSAARLAIAGADMGFDRCSCPSTRYLSICSSATTCRGVRTLQTSSRNFRSHECEHRRLFTTRRSNSCRLGQYTSSLPTYTYTRLCTRHAGAPDMPANRVHMHA